MKEIVKDVNLVAYCGLYCGACGAYLKGRCPGCHENTKAGWCKVRSCCIENSYASCADCTKHTDPLNCRNFNNFISKAIGFILNSDRSKCIAKIKTEGIDSFAGFMTDRKLQTLPRHEKKK